MQQLQFVELDEGGHLVVSAADGTRYAVPVDDRLRSALRPRPRPDPSGRTGSPSASPRDVQSLIRAGQTAEEVATLTGWELDRVRRFEGPVLAEREHVASLAQRAHVRAQGRTDGTHTLDRRVRERLQARGVELGDISWDAARHAAHGPWTVLVIFSAGGRERRAAWHYDVATRAIDALDDEARWLSEDEQALPGGLAGHPILGGSHSEDEAAADLMASMRERRQRRNRRPRKELGAHDPAHVPGQQSMPDEVLPLEDLHYDPDTMGDPPAAHPRSDAPGSDAPATEESGTEESAASVEPAEGTETEEPQEDAQAQDEPGGPQDEHEADAEAGGDLPSRPARGAAARRQRRRLRIPKLAVEPPAPVEPDPEPDGAYARTLEPGEVSFDEFFGTDEEPESEVHDAEEPDAEAHDDEQPAEVAAQDGPDAEVLHAEALDAGDDEDAVDDEAQDEDPGGPMGTAGQSEEEAPADTSGPEAEPEPEPERGSSTESRPGPGSATAEDETAGPQAPAAAPPGSSPSRSSTPPRKGRTSVPSWDDIMFGSRDRG